MRARCCNPQCNMVYVINTATLIILIQISSCVAEYYIGIGRADMTGPAAEINMMGYAKKEQKSAGIHLRQFSRAFIIDDGIKKVLFVSADCGMISHAVRKQVLDNLQEMYGDMYNENNFLLSGTHTHSGPGGFNKYLLYDISIFGFHQQTLDAYVNGITRSIRRAHNNMKKGRIFISVGEVEGASINRSPTAYENNPEEERKIYKFDVDKTIVQMKFEDVDGKPIGAIHWFAVHPTSMNNTNKLISSDNVGYASLLFEQLMDPDILPGKGHFVSAFASTNLGDVSPNTAGPRCAESGLPCDMHRSTCPGNDHCIAAGPGRDMFESTEIIASKIVHEAMELFSKNDSHEVNGPIRFAHQYIDMPNTTANIYDNVSKSFTAVQGCLPAMGYSFAAGTIDGVGSNLFSQGMTTELSFVSLIRNLFVSIPEDYRMCHGVKPILFPTGIVDFPYPWQPRIVSTQVALIGDVLLVCVPGEFTTMSGRRLRSAMKDVLQSSAKYIIIAGLCNTYSSYITTYEEYQVQRYEGASTIFGPHTLSIYIQQYKKLARAVLEGEQIKSNVEPPEFPENLNSFITPVFFDSAPTGCNFGDVIEQPQEIVHPGERVAVRFISGHPRNNLRHEDTFLTVERKAYNDKWIVMATDANWETRFHWKRTQGAKSEVLITWDVPTRTVPGEYRITHYGHYKNFFYGIFEYKGTSRTFKVVNPSFQTT